MNDDQILDYWANYMRAQNCTERTIKERMIFMRSVIRHSGQDSVMGITKHHLIAFLGKRDAKGNMLTGRTKQNYRSTLHTFFTWMQDEDMRLDNPAARLPRPQVAVAEPNPVSTSDIQRVLNSGIYGMTVMKVLLYSYQGFRASEVAAVSGASIDWENRTIVSREGKGRKEVVRPLHSVVYEHAIDAGYSRTDYWFPSDNESGHVRGRTVSTVLCAAFRRAGIDHKAHDMRKWHGTTMIENGADSLDVQHSLRHSDSQSMKAYIRPSQRRISDEMERLPRVVVPLVRRRPEADLRQAA